MTEKKNEAGEYPAFPITAGQQVYASGLTQRDWFAGQVLTACSTDASPQRVAKLAYQLADTMLATRADHTK